MNFYSARLLFIILIDDGKPRRKNQFDESVIVFRARSFEDAFERALALGKEKETKYKNDKGQGVRWALKSILNLDLIGKKVDGSEVSSVLHYRVSKEPIPFGKQFKPQNSEPSESF